MHHRSLLALVAVGVLLAEAIAFAAPEEAGPVEQPRLGELRGAFQADFNEDGSRVLVRQRSGETDLWNVHDGTPATGDLAAIPPSTCYQTSEDRKVVALGFADGTRVFDMTSGAAVSPMLPAALRDELVIAAVFSPVNRTLVIFEPKEATIWDVASGERIAAIPLPDGPHDDAPPLAIFTGDGAHCFVMDANGSVTRYETRSWKPAGKPIRHPRLETAYEFAFALSPDGKWLATFDDAGENGSKGHLQVWDAISSKPLGAPLVRTNGFDAQFFAKTPRVLVKPARGEAGVRELPSMKSAFSIPARDDIEGPSLAITPDEKWILAWGADRTVAVLDAANGQLKNHYPAKATIMAVLPAPDSTAALIVYDNSTFSTEGHQDNYIIRLRLPEANVTASFRSGEYLRRIRLSRDGRRLLVLEGGDDQERVRVLNAADLALIGTPNE